MGVPPQTDELLNAWPAPAAALKAGIRAESGYKDYLAPQKDSEVNATRLLIDGLGSDSEDGVPDIPPTEKRGPKTPTGGANHIHRPKRNKLIELRLTSRGPSMGRPRRGCSWPVPPR